MNNLPLASSPNQPTNPRKSFCTLNKESLGMNIFSNNVLNSYSLDNSLKMQSGNNSIEGYEYGKLTKKRTKESPDIQFKRKSSCNNQYMESDSILQPKSRGNMMNNCYKDNNFNSKLQNSALNFLRNNKNYPNLYNFFDHNLNNTLSPRKIEGGSNTNIKTITKKINKSSLSLRTINPYNYFPAMQQNEFTHKIKSNIKSKSNKYLKLTSYPLNLLREKEFINTISENNEKSCDSNKDSASQKNPSSKNASVACDSSFIDMKPNKKISCEDNIIPRTSHYMETTLKTIKEDNETPYGLDQQNGFSRKQLQAIHENNSEFNDEIQNYKSRILNSGEQAAYKITYNKNNHSKVGANAQNSSSKIQITSNNLIENIVESIKENKSDSFSCVSDDDSSNSSSANDVDNSEIKSIKRFKKQEEKNLEQVNFKKLKSLELEKKESLIISGRSIIKSHQDIIPENDNHKENIVRRINSFVSANKENDNEIKDCVSDIEIDSDSNSNNKIGCNKDSLNGIEIESKESHKIKLNSNRDKKKIYSDNGTIDNKTRDGKKFELDNEKGKVNREKLENSHNSITKNIYQEKFMIENKQSTILKHDKIDDLEINELIVNEISSEDESD